jgi:hypothetical protein
MGFSCAAPRAVHLAEETRAGGACETAVHFVAERNMTGALLQLVSVGTQNYFLNSNPKKTFFKTPLETHTHFAMESKTVTFNRNDMNISESTKLICGIPRHGDLLLDITFCCQLPDLYYGLTHNVRPKWIREVGTVMLNSVQFIVGGNTVDTCYGEWLSIWASLSMPVSKVHLYNKMIGNVAQCFDPDVLIDQIDPTKPFVKGRLLMIPLKFWFSRNPGCALPLLSLQYEFVQVAVELRPLIDLYLVNPRGAGYRRPQFGNAEHAFINFNTSKTYTNSVEISPYLEVNYAYLDDPERDKFALDSQDYMIEQITRVEKGNVSGSTTLQLVLQNPIKELVFVARDTRVQGTNEWHRYTNFDDGTDILQTVKILFNGMERLGERPIEYFGMLQPFRHHSSSPRDGVYVYSFALEPEQFQPSGECNASKINSMQLCVKVAPGVMCDVVVYAVSINFLRMTNGMAHVAFAL